MARASAERLRRDVGMVELRPAAATDFDYLWALHRSVMRESVERVIPWDDDFQGERLARHFDPATLRLIYADGVRVGTVSLLQEAGVIRIQQFYIEAARQGQGLGSVVLGFVLQAARRRGLSVRLSVMRGSAAARLYQRFAFRLLGSDAYQDHYEATPMVRLPSREEEGVA